MRVRPVVARAMRTDSCTASEPLLPKATRSAEGTSRQIASASSASSGWQAPKQRPRSSCARMAEMTAAGEWPRIIGP